MAENKNNLSINDDHSNAAMTHTSDAIASSDFIIRKLYLNQEPEMQRESKNFWQDAWAQLKRNKLAVVGMIGLIIIVIFAFIGPVINKHDYAEQNVQHRNLPAKIPVLDKVPFYLLMVKMQMARMLIKQQMLKKIIGLVLISWVEIYGQEHGKVLKFHCLSVLLQRC